MSLLPWFEADPDRLQKELDSLTALGVKHHVDAASRRYGILQLDLTIEDSNPAFDLAGSPEPLVLQVILPDNYPYFRPEVFAPGLSMPRHQDPFGKNLCLLQQPTANWEPQWTLVEYLQSQLPKVLRKGNVQDPVTVAADPEEQAEPVSVYYSNSNLPVIFDGSWADEIPVQDRDILLLGKAHIGLPEEVGYPMRMAVLDITTVSGDKAGELPDSFRKHFPRSIDGVILRLKEAPPTGKASEDLAWLKKLAASAQIDISSKQQLPSKDGVKLIGFIGLNFPEEVKPGVMGMGWVFLITFSVRDSYPVLGRKAMQYDRSVSNYGKPLRAGKGDFQVRVPKLAGLKNKSIAVVGLGAIGAPATIEFARNQLGELRLLDFDIVEPGTTVRWSLGLASSGLLKTEALKTFIEENYPNTFVRAFNHKIGTVVPQINRKNGQLSEVQLLDQLFDGVSLLFDASAEVGVNHYLSREARRRGVPYISIYATPGAWGGLVMRVNPDKDQGCWMCLQFAKDDGSIPVPVGDDKGELQTAGWLYRVSFRFAAGFSGWCSACGCHLMFKR